MDLPPGHADDALARAKRTLRGQLRDLLRQVTAGERAQASAEARALLARQLRWQAARSILFYAPRSDELDLWPLLAEALAQSRRVALPRFDPVRGGYEAAQVRCLEAEVVSGAFGIREPARGCPAVDLNQLDFVLVPGLGFDLDGRRLGRGKGYYDRLLAGVRAFLCGVAFEGQVLPAIPAGARDRKLDCILTPRRWTLCAARPVRE
jgi:5-formyltetrahydrofolate cyclo-ligase